MEQDAASINREAMEQDAASINRDFVGGKIMWLPKKVMIDPGDMPDLEDELFDHPVVIISKERTDRGIVCVLIMTTFRGMGLEFRHPGNSVEALLYAPVHPAPKHPNIVACTGPFQLEFNGDAKTFKKQSWLNLRRSYSVPYECLDYWQPWKGERNKTLTLEKESYGDLMRYLREDVPVYRELVELREKKKKEETKRKEEVNKTLRSNQWSKSIDEMLRDADEERKKAEITCKHGCPLECSCYKCRGSWRSGMSGLSCTEKYMLSRRTSDVQPLQQSGTEIPGENVQRGSSAATTISDDPPKSKSMSSAMISGPGSYIHKVKEEETETPVDDVQATTSETRSFIDLSTTLGQKPLAPAPPEALEG